MVKEKHMTVSKTAITSQQPQRPPLLRKNQQRREARDKVLKALRQHEGVPLDPAVEAWSDQLMNLFTRDGELVSCPLFSNNFPCPTSLAVNYASNIMTGSTDFMFWPIVQGAVFNGEEYVSAKATFAGAVVGNLGPILKGSTRDSVASAYYVGVAQHPTIAAASVQPLMWDTLETPFAYPDNGTGKGVEARCVAYNVRVTFTGALNATKGWVEWAAPYEPPINDPGASSFDDYHRDKSYRREFFSSQRTFIIRWQPTCDDIKFVANNCDVASTNISTRLPFRVGGLLATDSILIEFMAVQEFTGAAAIPTQRARLQTPDATHVANALVIGHGTINSEAVVQSSGATKRAPALHLKHIVKAAKASTHGYVGRFIGGAEHLLKNVSKVTALAKTAGSVWGELAALAA